MKSLFLLALLAALNVSAQTGRFYLGTYTDKSPSQGIYTGTLDSRTGKLGPLELAATLKSPTFLALSPDGKFLYALTATNSGTIAAFRVEPDGRLVFLNQISSFTVDCHVSVDATGRNVFAASYGGGKIVSFSTRPDGSLDKRTALIPFAGSGPNLSRQDKSHLHSTYLDASNQHLYACDLGTDKIWLFNFDAQSGQLTHANPAFAKVPPGSGSRHLVFSPDGRFAYVNGEMGMNVTRFIHNAKTGALTAKETVSVLPPDTDTNGLTSAEIFLHPSGKWLYVSNRDATKQGRDSLSLFDINPDGTLVLRQNFPSPVKVPRGFAVDPGGRWLLVGGQADNQIAVLKIDAVTGKLSATDQIAAVGAPVCVVFAK